MRDHIVWRGDSLDLLDQRRLPGAEERVILSTAKEVACAIRDLVIRGAPAIGITAAYGMVLGARQGMPVADVYQLLLGARPTAVNLKWALDRMVKAAGDRADPASLEREAITIHREDIDLCLAIGRSGAELVPAGSRVLTHCNAGALATGGHGTALGVIRSALAQHGKLEVFATETRPVWQGARLTAWELTREGIPVTLLPDSAAGFLMSGGDLDLVIVGADRVSASGDVANKIGTYPLAVLARKHGIPFYVAIPYSTVDFSCSRLDRTMIENRPGSEVTHVGETMVAARGAAVLNPAFDITPPELVTSFITDRGIVRPPFERGLALLRRGDTNSA